MEEKRLCMVCFIKHSVRRYTEYFCKPCMTPICNIDCYDIHRNIKDDTDERKIFRKFI